MALVAFTAICGALALIAIARQAADPSALSDTAVIESFTLLASQGQLLLGPYSRFQWHHPGPLSFYWMAPFYVLAGSRTTGLNAGALALNLGALAFIAWILLRRANGPVALAICGALVLFAWRASELLVSPWNAHVPVIPTMALLVAAADALSGSPATLPLVVALASLAGQTYVGVFPIAMAVMGVALVGSGVTMWSAATPRRQVWRVISTTVLVLVVVWAPSIVEQLTNRPGNFSRLWTFFVSNPHPGPPVSLARSGWADMLSGLLRPNFSVAHGWRFAKGRAPSAEILAMAELLGLALVGVRAWRSRHRFELSLASLLVFGSLLAFWSATRIEGEIFDQNIFWMSGLGVLNVGMLFGLILGFALGRSRAASSPAWMARAACWALMIGATVFGVGELRQAAARSFSPGAESEAASAVAADLQTYLAEHRFSRPLIRIDQEAWTMVAGVVLQLQKASVPVAVEDDWIAMFTPAFAATGHEPVEIAIVGRAEHVRLSDRPGYRVIASRDPLYAHVLDR